MTSIFVEAIIQQMIWLNLGTTLVVTALLPVRRGWPERFTSFMLRRTSNSVILFVVWMGALMIVPLFVPIEYQFELFYETAIHFPITAFPLGGFCYIAISIIKGKETKEKSES